MDMKKIKCILRLMQLQYIFPGTGAAFQDPHIPGKSSKAGKERLVIAQWETNRNNPKLENLIKICEMFHVSSDWLLFGKEKEIAERGPAQITEELRKRIDVLEKHIALQEEYISLLKKTDAQPAQKRKIAHPTK